MKLHEYIREKRMNIRQFSALSKVSLTALYQILKGARPQMTNASRIERATHGQVTLDDLGFDYLPFKKKPMRKKKEASDE